MCRGGPPLWTEQPTRSGAKTWQPPVAQEVGRRLTGGKLLGDLGKVSVSAWVLSFYGKKGLGGIRPLRLATVCVTAVAVTAVWAACATDWAAVPAACWFTLASVALAAASSVTCAGHLQFEVVGVVFPLALPSGGGGQCSRGLGFLKGSTHRVLELFQGALAPLCACAAGRREHPLAVSSFSIHTKTTWSRSPCPICSCAALMIASFATPFFIRPRANSVRVVIAYRCFLNVSGAAHKSMISCRFSADCAASA